MRVMVSGWSPVLVDLEPLADDGVVRTAFKCQVRVRGVSGRVKLNFASDAPSVRVCTSGLFSERGGYTDVLMLAAPVGVTEDEERE